MGDRELAIVCAALAIAGIIVLHFSATAPTVTALEQWSVGKRVTLQGIVEEKSIINRNVFVTIGNHTAVFFEPKDDGPYVALKGQRVCATGVVAAYRGALELLGEGLSAC